MERVVKKQGPNNILKIGGQEYELYTDEDGHDYILLKHILDNDEEGQTWDARYIPPIEGPMKFTIDKQTLYNYWPDYPDKIKPEDKKIFDEENPFWANFRRKK